MVEYHLGLSHRWLVRTVRAFLSLGLVPWLTVEGRERDSSIGQTRQFRCRRWLPNRVLSDGFLPLSLPRDVRYTIIKAIRKKNNKPQNVLRWTWSWTWTNVLLARHILLGSSKYISFINTYCSNSHEYYWSGNMYCCFKGVRIEAFNMHCRATAQHIEWKVSYYISFCPRCEIVSGHRL